MVIAWDAWLEGIGNLTSSRIQAGSAQICIVEMHAGQYHLWRTDLCQALQHPFDIGLGIRPLHIRLIQHKSCFRQIWHDDICLCAQLAHFLGKFRGKAAV